MGSHFDDERVVGRSWPSEAIAAIAIRQRGCVSHQQLASLGLSRSGISRAAGRGLLFRVHRGVYALAPLALRPQQAAEWAAVLAYGERALLSHETALWLHGINLVGSTNTTVHVTLVGGRTKPAHSGVIVHQAATLHPSEHHRLHGLPVTSVARTVIDLSPTQSIRGRERLVDEALRKTSRTKLNEAVARHFGRPGVRALSALLDPDRPSSLTWSKAEERLRELLRRAGLPAPESNVELYSGYKPDLLWREQRVIVEYHSREFHSGPGSSKRDPERHNRLTSEGYQLLYVDIELLADRPEQLLVLIAQALVR